MKQIRTLLVLVMAVLLAFGGVVAAPAANAATTPPDYVSVTKTVSPSSITTLEEATVTLGITGTPPVGVTVPNDVILVIDKSGSMLPSYNNGEDKMTNAKEAAKGFIDLMDLTKHRVGIVDFSSSNIIGSFPLTDDATAAKNYINTIQANGSTATGDAIQTAMDMLAGHRSEAQPVIVLLTDGDATQPSNDPYGYALQKAEAAKDAGIIFYTIALLKATDDPDSSGPNILLKDMATTASHHHFVLGSVGLAEIYAQIVKEIGMASAYNVQVKDVVPSGFEIVPGSYDNNIPKPTVTGNTLTWDFNELKNSTLNFTYKIRPVDKTKAGTFNITDPTSIITYKDYAGAARNKAIPSTNLAVTLPAPVITSITPAEGSPAGGNTVTIDGKNFVAGATVLFGTKAATSVQVVSDQQITAVVPAGSQGTVTVTVTNPDKQKATTQYAYKATPVITSLSPVNGPIAGGTNVLINGSNFMAGATVKFGDLLGTITLNNGSSYIKVTTPAVTTGGPVDVTLTNPDGTFVTMKGAFTYDAPPVIELKITTLTANEGLVAGGEAVYIDGTKFESGSKFYFGASEATLTNFYNSIRVKVTAPAAAAAGAVDVKVVNPDGSSYTLTGGYTYKLPPELPAPVVTTLTAAEGQLAGGEIVYIDGANFVSGVKIYFGGVQATVNTFYSSVRLKVTAPAGTAAGTVDVKAVNPDSKEGVKVAGYKYLAPPPLPAPTITQISPNTGLIAGGYIAYIDGTNFVSGLKVYIGATEATVNNFYNATRIKITIPAAADAGVVDVKIVNPDLQEAVLAGGFAYTKPAPPPVTVTAVSPNTGSTAGGELLYIDGTNFAAGATVTFGTTTVPIISVVSATRVKVYAPAATQAGTVDITVTNTDGQSGTLVAAYTYTAKQPTITALSPNHGALAGGYLTYIDGTNFESDMTVTVDGVVVPISTFYSATRIKIILPSRSTAGTVPLVVTLKNGNSASTTFTYDAPPALPAPQITALSVTSAKSTGTTLMYIDGANFVSGMKVYFGTKEATIITFYNSARIKIYIPAGTAGPVDVKIVNPDGQSSNLMTFTYL